MCKNDFITWVFRFACAYRYIRPTQYMEFAEV